MAKTEMRRLRLATEIDMLGDPPPLVNGPDGPSVMTVGSLLGMVIPTCLVGGLPVWRKVALKRAFDAAKEVDGKKKKVSLCISAETDAPEDENPRLRTVGGLIVSSIPSLTARDDLNAVMLWDIGGKIRNAEGSTVVLSKADFETLKASLGVDREADDAIRLSDIAADIDSCDSPTFDLPQLDLDMLRKKCKEGNRPTWVVVNLKNAFDEAKEVGKDDK